MHRTDTPRHGSVWRSRGIRWGAAVAALLGSSLLVMFGLMFWRSSVLLFDTLDRTVIEQLSLLSARPPELLSFMILSRMNQQPAVITQVGLFDAGRVLLVGDVTKVPDDLRLDSTVHAIADPLHPAVHWRAAGRVLPDGRILVVARAADEILDVRANLGHGALAGIIPAILLSLGGGALIGMATEARLRRLSAVAERIIEGDLSARLAARVDGDELDRLCTIVNRMLDQLEEAFEALKAVGGNIAHDLRTPLTSLRARLERSAAMAGPAGEVGVSITRSIDSVDQALSIISALLRIGDIQHGRWQDGFAPFDLAAVVSETAETYQPVAADKGVDLSCRIDNPASIVGDRQLMVELLVNLVDNAVKFTPTGGCVRIALEGPSDRPLIVVSDTGPGIPEQARSAVFQRFYRAEASRSTPGSGLGLSLTAAVAKLHRFEIRLGDNAPGCRVELLCWPTEQTTGPLPLQHR
jgi:signal transduction histidine kinase